MPRGKAAPEDLDFILMAVGAGHGLTAKGTQAQTCLGTQGTCPVQVT